jgi:sec-independent protein translocase protein TatB
MFNLGAGEIAVILIVALLLLGPDKLPELARGIGKFVREFRRQTDDVRGLVEREFYKMDQEVVAEEQAQAKRIEPPAPAEPVPPPTVGPDGELTHRPTRPSSRRPRAGRRSPGLRRPLGIEPAAPAPAEPAAAPASEPVASARPEGDPRRMAEQEPLQARMSLAEHLGELRSRLLRVVIAVLVLGAAGLVSPDPSSIPDEAGARRAPAR